MVISKGQFKDMLAGAAEGWLENSPALNQIDSRYGDGDHGVSVSKIARVIQGEIAGDDDQLDLPGLARSLSKAVLRVSAGSAGPLYGTLFSGLAAALAGKSSLDAPDLKIMFSRALSDMRLITEAQVGDKTMMDALIPAVEAALAAPDELPEILAAAAEAAAHGAEATKEQVAKFGRAKSYGAQTLGSMDAGALSMSLFFMGLKRGFDTKHR